MNASITYSSRARAACRDPDWTEPDSHDRHSLWSILPGFPISSAGPLNLKKKKKKKKKNHKKNQLNQSSQTLIDWKMMEEHLPPRWKTLVDVCVGSGQWQPWQRRSSDGTTPIEIHHWHSKANWIEWIKKKKLN